MERIQPKGGLPVGAIPAILRLGLCIRQWYWTEFTVKAVTSRINQRVHTVLIADYQTVGQ